MTCFFNSVNRTGRKIPGNGVGLGCGGVVLGVPVGAEVGPGPGDAMGPGGTAVGPVDGAGEGVTDTDGTGVGVGDGVVGVPSAESGAPAAIHCASRF